MVRPSSPPQATAGNPGPTWVLLVGTVVLTGFSLRTAVGAVSPVLEQIRADDGLSVPAAALLTTLPVLCFGFGALVAARLGRRFGLAAALAGAMVVLAGGLLLRLAPGVVALFGGTVLAGAGIALGNVLVPAVVKQDATPRAVGPLLGLSTVTISAGAAVSAAVTLPLQQALGTSWRPAVAAWALPAALAALAWVLVRRRARRRLAVATGAVPGLWRRASAWQVTLLMGLQSWHYFALFAWAPTILVAAGWTPQQGGLLLAVAGLAAMPANYLTPVLATRRRTQHHLVTAMLVLLGAGTAGLLVAPAAAVVWMVLIGLGQGTGLSLSHALMTVRARSGAATAELSGMAQGSATCWRRPARSCWVRSSR